MLEPDHSRVLIFPDCRLMLGVDTIPGAPPIITPATHPGLSQGIRCPSGVIISGRWGYHCTTLSLPTHYQSSLSFQRNTISSPVQQNLKKLYIYIWNLGHYIDQWIIFIFWDSSSDRRKFYKLKIVRRLYLNVPTFASQVIKRGRGDRSVVCHRLVSGTFKLSLSAQSFNQSLKYFILIFFIRYFLLIE